jgi:SAM-dependent methyltransferase/pimeloyl-ACP methyl ester carboxylesterase
VQLTDLQRLHRNAISNRIEIKRILNSVEEHEIVLNNGMDHKNRRRTARVVKLSSSGVVLRHENIDPRKQSVLVFSFELDGGSYSLGGNPVPGRWTSTHLEIDWPTQIHVTERRTRVRETAIEPELVTIEFPNDHLEGISGEVSDRSTGGLGVMVGGPADVEIGSVLSIRYGTGQRAGQEDLAEVRNSAFNEKSGWRRLGMTLNPAPIDRRIPIERRSKTLPGGLGSRGWNRVSFGGQTMRLVSRRMASRLGARQPWNDKICVVEFRNGKGQLLKGIVDRTDSTPGGAAVVIPPAWGRRKETLMPLARTLVETFNAAGRSLTVLRFDGTQRRGESFVDPECRTPGDEALNFTYSQAAEDLLSAANFLRASPEFAVKQLALVTFSLAAIEGRIALTADSKKLYDAWISVVGMPDVQSALKSVSGGIDYVFGSEAGIAFGIHELGGVRIDIDHAAKDVLESGIGTLDEAKRDMARISIPVTWIHGRHDGWTNVERARDLLSAGCSDGRKLIEVPTGHQLRNSREALDTFQLIAHEVSGMLLDTSLAPRAPSLIDLDRRSEEERERISSSITDLRKFWHDYLLGRDGSIGMQLLGATRKYGSFMADQIAGLQLREGMRVLDLGSGMGEFSSHLSRLGVAPLRLRVVSADFVYDAIRRARDSVSVDDKIAYDFCVADCEQHLPFASGVFDRVLLSLVVSYVHSAEDLLDEIYRVMRPGGILVLSSPKRDADLSTVYREMMDDLVPEKFESMIAADQGSSFDKAQRDYLNEAARLVDFEESGRFRFRDQDELSRIVRIARFRRITSSLSLGDPPQTAIVYAAKDG